MRKHYSLRYFTKLAMTGLWRNGVMSVASVAVLMSCLVVLGCFALLLVNINVNLENVAQLNQIVAFCEYDLDEETIVDIENQIRDLDYVDSVTRVTKAEALEEMREQSGDPELYDDITDENNPLSDSFEIMYEGTDENQVYELEAQLRSIEGVRRINSVYQVARTLDNLKNGIMLVFLWFLIILFVVSIFVIINTIKLAVYSRRSEISVMRYVGATNWFITLPFILEGVLIGVFASLIGFAVETYIYSYVENMALSDLEMISILSYRSIALPLFFGFIVIGVITGIIGSVASLRKYLKS
ncbi:MAG: permease-like cell division protein FtsX [Clostridiales bacterium]|nr:permease-like cell division protein FtsX [Clostridiales bacterium]